MSIACLADEIYRIYIFLNISVLNSWLAPCSIIKIQVILIIESILCIYNPVREVMILLDFVGFLFYAHVSSLQDKKANITVGFDYY